MNPPTSDILFAIILLGELIGFYFFYSTESGTESVYYAWYAWVIDAFAIASGAFLMGLGVYVTHNPQLFTAPVPFELVLLLFLLGSWQASIHAVKWLLRFQEHGLE